jgi:hypothetical protein
MSKKYTAQCACGAVKFEFNTDPDLVAVCHCLDCKKSLGGEAATFFGVPEDDFTLSKGNPKARHYIAESAKGSTATSVLSAGREYSPTIWGASPVSSSSRWAASTGLN